MIFHNYESRLEAFQCLIKDLEFKRPFRTEPFLKAPASTKYHGNYEGGLFDHSYTVYKALQELTEKMSLNWSRPESPIIVGLFHDLCKVDQYEKNPEHSPQPYTYKTDLLMPGHGEKSIIYLQQYLDLTAEEIYCIRWHMGAFDEKENWNYYSRAVEQYPNVLWTHTADMIASKIKGV